MKKLILITVALLFTLIVNAQIDYNTDSIINVCINEINADSIEQHILHLENFGTRFMLAPNRKEIANWIKDKFIDLGYTNTIIDSFKTETHCHYGIANWDTITWQYNVIAELQGSQSQDSSVIIGAHYDSYNESLDPFISAPGADDDGSGVGAIIEIARVFKKLNYIPENNIKFIAFAAEELVFFSDYSGSKNYAEKANLNNDKIQFYLNLDMIANTTALSDRRLIIFSYDNSIAVTDLAVNCCNSYSEIIPNVVDIYFGGVDSYWFYSNGYKTVYFEEYDFSPNYHSSNDIVNNCNMNYCAEVTKVSLAMLISSTTVATAIVSSNNSLKEINVFPNPTTGKITIMADDIENIEVMNIEGRQIYNGKENKVDLTNQPKGIYIIKISKDKQIITQKLIKQ